jgi:pimeloyl-ACP methyl ester carboxylesterase
MSHRVCRHDQAGSTAAGHTGRFAESAFPEPHMTTSAMFHWTLAAAAAGLAMTCGCSMNAAHRHDLDRHGYVFYCDGAGGGGVLSNWGTGVREGLRQADYRGDFHCFPWNTGLGVVADQGASVEYKRQKAGELARQMVTYMDSHPGQNVNLVGLSAGTAVVVFALEALPEDHPVNDVVLLGSSVSSHYDLSKALKRVRHHVHVFTSEKDAVLGVAVSVAGTADRQFCGACSAGLKGFHLPARADTATRRLYAKVDNIAWVPEFARAGNYGGHTDAVNARFIRDYVAPLLFREGPSFIAAGPQPERDNAASPTGT